MMIVLIILGFLGVIISTGLAVVKNINQFVACFLGNTRGYGVFGIWLALYLSEINEIWIPMLVGSIIMLIVSSVLIYIIEFYNNKNNKKVEKISSVLLALLFLAIAVVFIGIGECCNGNNLAQIVWGMLSLISVSMAFCSWLGDGEISNLPDTPRKKFLAGRSCYSNTDHCICGHDYHHGHECPCGHKD